ncbi:FAD-dependent oxidoreductase [Cryptosporangium aurantiacum]|uniref:2-polyprenyl-6-methoxyphenol hydroxylase n=1 Tax=Cryptosporangium aurantiacum TaxID=134849 RepID=A0A1M7RGL9_9ACTN|nr:FAD-dependent monooxygenase [Cryptosporangium aurantiacum]SHN45311.1 2-polyprenyl-6-methoxyphenol hydroxylase [Cryptosporangium aurantiacum]
MSASPAHVFRRLSSTHQPHVPNKRLRHAVVLGGSVAGLLAARVLADHAEDVVVVERDDSVDGERRGVPQRFQVHALLPGGRAQIERWFPGFTDEAIGHGAVFTNAHQTQQWADDVCSVTTPNAVLLNASRSFIEAQLRRHTRALPNVRLLTAFATGLEYRDGRVSGVRLDAGESLPAAFVVDAMGRSSRLSDWLERDGWEAPELERMQIDVNYATAYFKRSQVQPPVGAAISRFTPGYHKKTQAALNGIEDGQWMLMLMTYGDDRLSRDWDEFLTRCADLPPVFAAVAREEPVGEVHTYRMADARRRRYDRAARLPGGLVSVGDAVASFNPVYGQGMSSATLHASCLSEYLCDGADPSAAATDFLRLQKVVVDAAWDLSTSGDAERLETGKPPLPVRLQRALINQVIAASVVDVTIGTKFNDVAFMNTHPSTLAAPSVLLRSVWANRRRQPPR